MGPRTQSSLESEIFRFIFLTFWRVSGLMLAGMALMKLGFLNGSRNASVYWRAASIAEFGVGIPLAVFGTCMHSAMGWNSNWGILSDYGINYWASLFVCFGWVGALMLPIWNCRS